MARALAEPLLDGLDLPLEAWSRWLLAERAEAERLRLGLLARLAHHPALDPGEALDFARDWAAEAPFSPRAAAATAGLLRRLGRAEEADATLAAFRRATAEAGLEAEVDDEAPVGPEPVPGPDPRRRGGCAAADAAPAGHRLLRGPGRGAHRLCPGGRRPAAGQGRQLAQPPRARLGRARSGRGPSRRWRTRHASSATTSAATACRTGTWRRSASRPSCATSRRWSRRSGSTASRSSACRRAAPSPSPMRCATRSGSRRWC